MNALPVTGWHWLILAVLCGAIGTLHWPERWAQMRQCAGLGLALGALSMALLLAVWPVSWKVPVPVVVQGILWLMLSCAWALGSYLWFRPRWASNASDRLSGQAQQLIGMRASLMGPMHQGCGRVQIRDALWQVRCEQDLPAGTLVEVVGHQGAELHVRKY